MKKELIKMTVALIHETDRQFIDISSEEYRIYTFGTTKIFIKNPQWLNVGTNGHRVLDSDKISHYIPYGWNHLEWKTLDGYPHFVR